MPEKYRDIQGSHLNQDKRILQVPVQRKEIFSSPMYVIEICLYPALKETSFKNELVTALITYKEESLRIMVKLATFDPSLGRDKQVQKVISNLASGGKSPLELVRSAKVWCNVPFTAHDRATLLTAGVDVP